MSDESVLAPEADPVAIPETVQPETAQPEAAPEQVDEQVSAAKGIAVHG